MLVKYFEVAHFSSANGRAPAPASNCRVGATDCTRKTSPVSPKQKDQVLPGEVDYASVYHERTTQPKSVIHPYIGVHKCKSFPLSIHCRPYA